MRSTIALFLLTSTTVLAQGLIDQNGRLPGLSADSKTFTPPPKEAADPFAKRRENPYNGKAVSSDPINLSAGIGKEQTIEIPIGDKIVLSIKDRDGRSVEPTFVSLTVPEIYTIEVTPDNSILLTSKLETNMFDALDKVEGGQTAKESTMFIGTSYGTLKTKLVITQSRTGSGIYNLRTAGSTAMGERPVEPEQFDYNLNPAPLNPLPNPLDAAPTQRGFGPESINTDKDSPSPEARVYNPYQESGNGPLNYHSVAGINAPQITAGLMPTAIQMMRHFDRQRERGATTDNDIQRKIVSKPYILHSWAERDAEGNIVKKDLQIWLAEAYRFPKYQTTAIRLVWNNTSKKSHYLDPTKVALRIGAYVHIPARYAQVRNVVNPGQNNEMYLVFRIPDVDLNQDYHLILPKAPRPALSAGPQILTP